MRQTITIALLFISCTSLSQTRVELDSLKLLLEKISVDDQKFRLGWDSIIQKYGINSTEFIELVEKMNRQDSINMSIGKLIDSILMDRDGNKYSLKVLLDSKLWMTTNLNLNIPDSYCYDNTKENCERYGRLYSWEAANQGCKLLGEGWRLPTNVEWQQLTLLYGGVSKDSNLIRKEAYKALRDTGTSGFNALLGGGRDPGGKYARFNAHGFYLTVTENDNNTAKFYNFAKGSQALYRQDDGEKTRAFSVRCLKSIDRL